MASFVIEGGHSLSGDIYPQGAKNEVLQIICATLLTAEERLEMSFASSFFCSLLLEKVSVFKRLLYHGRSLSA